MVTPRAFMKLGSASAISGDVRSEATTGRVRGTDQIGHRNAPVFQPPLQPVVSMRSPIGATRRKGSPRKANQSAPGTPSFFGVLLALDTAHLRRLESGVAVSFHAPRVR